MRIVGNCVRRGGRRIFKKQIVWLEGFHKFNFQSCSRIISFLKHASTSFLLQLPPEQNAITKPNQSYMAPTSLFDHTVKDGVVLAAFQLSPTFPSSIYNLKTILKIVMHELARVSFHLAPCQRKNNFPEFLWFFQACVTRNEKNGSFSLGRRIASSPQLLITLIYTVFGSCLALWVVFPSAEKFSGT